MKYLPFAVRLTSLSMIISRSIHVAANGIISFFFVAEECSTVYIYIPHLPYPFICRWTLRLLQALVTVNAPAINTRAFPVAQMVKNLPAVLAHQVGWEDLLEKGMATHATIFTRRIPCIDEHKHWGSYIFSRYVPREWDCWITRQFYFSFF